MKFSVLLPTRNGGAYIENCVHSILEQTFSDFELVISDNANADGTSEILHSFTDQRIRILRQERVLSVSDNWKATFDAAQGDYLLMMGDDDYLLPDALSRLDAALSRNGNPDCVLFNAYSFVAPQAVSEDQRSFCAQYHFPFGADFHGEEIMSSEQRISIVKDMFDYRQRIPLNMQTTLFSRRAALAAPGGVFVPPFPDHYLLCALLISAGRWLFLPRRLVIVGISPKSFGHYFYGQQDAAGLSYLGVDTDFKGALPGNQLLNGMTCWLLRLKEFFPRELEDVSINRGAYVLRQLYFSMMQSMYRSIGVEEFARRVALMSYRDWLGVLREAMSLAVARRLWSTFSARRKSRIERMWRGLTPLENCRDIRQFAESISHVSPR